MQIVAHDYMAEQDRIRAAKPLSTPPEFDPFRETDTMLEEIKELQRKLATQSDVIHMLVQGYTALLRAQNENINV